MSIGLHETQFVAYHNSTVPMVAIALKTSFTIMVASDQ